MALVTRGETSSRISLWVTRPWRHGDERWPMEVTSNTYFRGVSTKNTISSQSAIWSFIQRNPDDGQRKPRRGNNRSSSDCAQIDADWFAAAPNNWRVSLKEITLSHQIYTRKKKAPLYTVNSDFAISCIYDDAVSAFSDASSGAVEAWAECRDDPEPGRELPELGRERGVAGRDEERDLGEPVRGEVAELGVPGLEWDSVAPVWDFCDFVEPGLDGCCSSPCLSPSPAVSGSGGASLGGVCARGCRAITGSTSLLITLWAASRCFRWFRFTARAEVEGTLICQHVYTKFLTRMNRAHALWWIYTNYTECELRPDGY